MKSYNVFVSVLVSVFALTSTIVHAEAKPVVSAVDTSSVYYAYVPGQRYPIVTYTGQLTTLVFPENEVIVVDPAVGVGEIWENIRLAVNILAVRPLNSVGRSNMAVVTEGVESKERRMYMFDLLIKPSPKTLTSGGALPSDMMWTIYFGDSKAAKWGVQKPVVEAVQKQASPAPAPEKVAVFPTVRTVPKRDRNMRYGYQGDAQLAPVEAFDNGVFTFLTFSATGELPVLTRVDIEGVEQLVNYRPDARDRNTFIVEGVYPVIVARYGALHACIVNAERVPNSKVILAPRTVRK